MSVSQENEGEPIAMVSGVLNLSFTSKNLSTHP